MKVRYSVTESFYCSTLRHSSKLSTSASLFSWRWTQKSASVVFPWTRNCFSTWSLYRSPYWQCLFWSSMKSGGLQTHPIPLGFILAIVSTYHATRYLSRKEMLLSSLMFIVRFAVTYLSSTSTYLFRVLSGKLSLDWPVQLVPVFWSPFFRYPKAAPMASMRSRNDDSHCHWSIFSTEQYVLTR